jgi:hypothetical protein
VHKSHERTVSAAPRYDIQELHSLLRKARYHPRQVVDFKTDVVYAGASRREITLHGPLIT